MRAFVWLAILGSANACFAAAAEPGLLFYLSGDNGFTAHYAAAWNGSLARPARGWRGSWTPYLREH
jgi:hypothetical protein